MMRPNLTARLSEKNWRRGFLWLFLVIGFALRFYEPLMINAATDDTTRDYHQVVSVLRGNADLPSYGPTYLPNRGVQVPGNLYYIITMPPLMVSSHPVALALYFYLLSGAALVAAYAALRKLYGDRVAVLATAFYAVAPWAVLSTRKLHHPNIAPFFFAILLYLLALVFKEKKPVWYSVALPMSFVLTQIHTANIVFVFAVIVLTVIYIRRLKVRYIVLGGVISVLLYFPTVLEIARGTFDFFSRAAAAADPSPLRVDALKVLLHPLVFATGELSQFFRNDFFPMLTFPSPLSFVLLLSIPAAMLTVLHTVVRSAGGLCRNIKTVIRKRPETVIVSSVVLCMILVNAARLKVVHPHYMYGIFPLPFLAVALFFFAKTRSRFWQLLRRYGGVFLLAAPLVISVMALHYVSLRGGTRGDFAANLRDQLAALVYMRTDSANDFTVREPRVFMNKEMGKISRFGTMAADLWPDFQPTGQSAVYRCYWCRPDERPPKKLFQRCQYYKRFYLLYVFRM